MSLNCLSLNYLCDWIIHFFVEHTVREGNHGFLALKLQWSFNENVQGKLMEFCHASNFIIHFFILWQKISILMVESSMIHIKYGLSHDLLISPIRVNCQSTLVALFWGQNINNKQLFTLDFYTVKPELTTTCLQQLPFWGAIFNVL